MITLQEIIERDKRPPSVTVSMICYNHEKYVEEAIRSVLMQKTNFPVNIVIHDDASPDGSAEIIRRYAADNPNITAILQPKNLYQNGKSSLPYVLPYCTGKYIAYCECDDFWIDKHKLQIQVDYLEAHPDCMSVYSNVYPIDKHSKHRKLPPYGLYNHKHTGDYPRNYLWGVRHQTASLVTRNFYRFMTPEDIDFYMRVRSNGDEKILALALRMGRVHFFSEQFAAHRSVTDEGDSYSARMARTDKYTKFCMAARSETEIYRMIEHFFGRKYRRKYVFVLFSELKSRIKFRKSVIKEAKLNPCYHLKNIPVYAYAALPFYAAYKAAKKTAKIILPRKVLTALKKLRYNQLSALSSQLSALSSQLSALSSWLSALSSWLSALSSWL